MVKTGACLSYVWGVCLYFFFSVSIIFFFWLTSQLERKKENNNKKNYDNTRLDYKMGDGWIGILVIIGYNDHMFYEPQCTRTFRGPLLYLLQVFPWFCLNNIYVSSKGLNEIQQFQLYHKNMRSFKGLQLKEGKMLLKCCFMWLKFTSK